MNIKTCFKNFTKYFSLYLYWRRQMTVKHPSPATPFQSKGTQHNLYFDFLHNTHPSIIYSQGHGSHVYIYIFIRYIIFYNIYCNNIYYYLLLFMGCILILFGYVLRGKWKIPRNGSETILYGEYINVYIAVIHTPPALSLLIYAWLIFFLLVFIRAMPYLHYARISV